MIRAKRNRRRLGLLAAPLAALGLALSASPALAASPAWEASSISNTTAQPGGTHDLSLNLRNTGDAATDGSPIALDVTLPTGMVGKSAGSIDLGSLDCPGIAGATSFTCISTETIGAGQGRVVLFTADVEPGASGAQTAAFAVEGGGAPPASTVDPVTITPTPPGFGIDAFDIELSDAAGAPFTQAAGHPASFDTHFDLNTATDPSPALGFLRPVETVKDVVAELPPGLLGNPSSATRCTQLKLANSANSDAQPLCEPTDQVGTALLRVGAGGPVGPYVSPLIGPFPLFNLVPPPDAPARLGFNAFGNLIVLDTELRSTGDYGLTVVSRNTPAAFAIAGTTVEIWGVPAAESHDSERACPGKTNPSNGGKTCDGAEEQLAFLRNPTSCSPTGAGLVNTLRVDSWENPGQFETRTIESHQPDGYPHAPNEWGDAQGTDGCAKVPFTPGLSVEPTTEAAASPSGLEVELTVPQQCWEHAEEVCQSDLRDAVISLPRGMSVNPAAAAGLGACSSDQIGLVGTGFPAPNPIRFDEAPAACPDDSKLGTVAIDTPLLGENGEGEEDLTGSVYLAKQADNPFGSLLALYLVLEGHGIRIKLAGEVSLGEDGRLSTSFADSPQTPFSRLRLQLFGGPRAALRTPPACGTFAARGSFAPWSGRPAVRVDGGFEIATGPGGGPCPDNGFDPGFSAGTANPLAASFSPFALRLTRADGTRPITGLSATLPEGLLGKLAGVSSCPDAVLAAIPGGLGSGAGQLASPSCPPGSQLGTVTVGAGAGPTPFFTQAGRVYLAGPYKGAPYSLAAVVPALAGPFDLGNVVVRNALAIDPVTTRITASSDPLPTSLFGIGLELRDIRVQIDRSEFTLNPTSCDPMSVEAAISGSGGAGAERSERFQVSGCRELGFRPKLSLRLKGATRRTAHPRLIANLKARPGDANIARAEVTLPRAAFLDQGHIRTVCTRVQFAAEACPKRSIYGRASATSPLLDYPLYGPVYLRSSDNPLPDLVVALRGPAGQPIEVELAGRTDTVRGALRSTFDFVPDAPVSRFRLELFGGKRGLVVLSRNLCARRFRAVVKLDGQNGKARDTRPVLGSSCHKGGKGKGKSRGSY